MHWAQGFYTELERAGWRRGNSSGMNQQTSSRKGSGEEHWVWQRALNLFHYINVFCDMHRHYLAFISTYPSGLRQRLFCSQIAPAAVICPAWHIFSQTAVMKCRVGSCSLMQALQTAIEKIVRLIKVDDLLCCKKYVLLKWQPWNFSPNSRGRLRNAWMDVIRWRSLGGRPSCRSRCGAEAM